MGARLSYIYADLGPQLGSLMEAGTYLNIIQEATSFTAWLVAQDPRGWANSEGLPEAQNYPDVSPLFSPDTHMAGTSLVLGSTYRNHKLDGPEHRATEQDGNTLARPPGGAQQSTGKTTTFRASVVLAFIFLALTDKPPLFFCLISDFNPCALRVPICTEVFLADFPAAAVLCGSLAQNHSYLLSRGQYPPAPDAWHRFLPSCRQGQVVGAGVFSSAWKA